MNNRTCKICVGYPDIVGSVSVEIPPELPFRMASAAAKWVFTHNPIFAQRARKEQAHLVVSWEEVEAHLNNA